MILNFLNKQIRKLQQNSKKVKIIFSEGDDLRILHACYLLKKDNIIEPILIGNKVKIFNLIKSKFSTNFNPIVYDPQNENEIFNNVVDKVYEIRKTKNSYDEIKKWMKQPNYFAPGLVVANYGDGVVGGATYSTADSVKPILQIFGAKNKFASSYMILAKNEKLLIFSDCALNAYPTSEQLALITKQTAKNAFLWNLEPKVALLSFSTHGSAKHKQVELVQNAINILKQNRQDFVFDGELQFDSAYVPSVAKQKTKNSIIKGDANVFIFPNLDAGNIGYKIAQRLGNYVAIGPIMQGLNKPFNDLSRGCDSSDVYAVAIITAMSI